MNQRSAPLRATHTVAYRYERSVGGATDRFLRGLAEGALIGSRMPGGSVRVPAIDHDPVSGAAAVEFVQVAETGTVRTWTWVSRPQADHPLDRPFAFALVQLDGADTGLLHAVDVADESAIGAGLRVRADWRAERTGSIRDLRAFVPVNDDTPPACPARVIRPGGAVPTPLTVATNATIAYRFEPGLVLSAFYRSLVDARIEGGRCERCAATYVPPRPGCPQCGTSPMTPIAVGASGTIESLSVVHLASPEIDVEVPFCWAWIRLDGTDVPFAHLVGGVEPADVYVGQRVTAEWAAPGDREPGWTAIRYFRPEES